MGWGFRNKNSHRGIDSSAVGGVADKEANTKNTSNNEYLAVPPPSKIPHRGLKLRLNNAYFKQNKSLFKPLLKCLRLQGGGYSTGGKCPHLQGGGFTLIETVVGLALVSISGFVVTFISGQMNTASKLTDDSYECAAIATNVMERFSQGGLEPIVLLNSEHFPGTPPTDFEAAIEERSTISVNTSGEATHNAGPNLVIEPHGSNSHITLKVDKFHRGSGVSLVEDLFNEYRSTICPSNVDNLTFDLADDMVITYEAGNTAKLIDLHKKLDDVKPATPGPEPDYYKEMADANLSSNHYAWDTFTSEYLYGLSKSLKNALNLHLLAGFTDYSTSYTNTAQPYDVKIGIRPWSLSNRSALGCTDTKVHPAVFLRPHSKYDRYITDSVLGTNELERQNKIGYKLERSLTSAQMRSDVGLKLFVEVKTRPGVDKLERSCKSNKLFAYANSFAVPPSRRPVYVHHDREIKDGSNDFIASTTHPLQNNPGLNVGYKYGAADSIPTKPDGNAHTTLSDYADELTLNFRNIGKVWRDVNNPSSFADDEEDFRGVFLCGFDKSSFEDCVKGPPDCDDIAGLSSYRPFGNGGVHKLGIRRSGTEYGSTDGSTSSPRWDLCENFKLTSSQPNRASLIASLSSVDDGKLGLELDNLNVSSWPDEDQDADYRVRFKLVDEYGNDYSATENGQIQSDDYTEEHRVFAYNCAQFGNTHASGIYATPPKNCGVTNPDPNIAKYNRRIDNPFYNARSDCEHTFNLLLGNGITNGTSSCVKLSNIRIYNNYFDDSIEERTGPANSPVRPVNGTGVTCDYWVEQCVNDGTACVQCGQGYMRDYPETTRQSCHGGSASLGGVTCYKAGVNCCSGVNNYNPFLCPTGGPCTNCSHPLDSLNRTVDRSCPSSVSCGFNEDPTCGATCNTNGLGCGICTGATPCNTPNCFSCSFGTPGVCQYKCGGGTPYCDGASNCVECLNDGHCGGDICCSYSCRAPCNASSNNCEECHGPCSSPVNRCSGGKVCDGSGGCVDPPPPPPPPPVCTPNPCPTGQTCCPDNQCRTNCCSVACDDDGDCNAGKTCQDAGQCSASCVTCVGGVGCNSDADCPGGVCQGAGNCGSSCCPVTCNSNSDCGAGKSCSDAGTCSSSCVDNPCPSGQVRCGAICKTPTCSGAGDCAVPTPTCQNPGTCTSICVTCSGAQPDCAATCQAVICGSGGWECDTSSGCPTGENCCTGVNPPVCKAPCVANNAACEQCADNCASPTSKCVPPQICNGSGTCYIPQTCGSRITDPECQQCTDPNSTTEIPRNKSGGCRSCGICNGGICNEPSTCPPCSGTPPTCDSDNCETAQCKNGSWVCEQGPSTCTANPATCTTCPKLCGTPVTGQPTCVSNTATCTTCDKPCGTPQTCPPGTTCDGSGGCVPVCSTPCSSNADCGCGGTCDAGTGCCTSTGPTCSGATPNCCPGSPPTCKASCGVTCGSGSMSGYPNTSDPSCNATSRSESGVECWTNTNCGATEVCDCCPWQCTEIRCENHHDCPTPYQCTVNVFDASMTGHCYTI